MRRVFISMPMRDKTDEEISVMREEYTAVIRAIEGEDVITTDSFLTESVESGDEKDRAALRLLGGALQKLAESDIAYFTDGWETARGCLVEHACCKAYGIPRRCIAIGREETE